MTAYDIVDDAAIIAALVAGEVPGGTPPRLANGGAVGPSYVEADVIGNGTAPMQRLDTAADVTVTMTSV